MSNEQLRILLQRIKNDLEIARDLAHVQLADKIGEQKKDMLGREYTYISEIEPIESVIEGMSRDIEVLSGGKE